MKTIRKKTCMVVVAVMLITVFSVPAAVGAKAEPTPKAKVPAVVEMTETAAVIQAAEKKTAKPMEELNKRILPNEGILWYDDSGLIVAVGNKSKIDKITEDDLRLPVTGIGQGTFANCTNLQTVEIPSHIDFIDEGVFQQCKKLTAFIVNPLNSNYKDDDGVLFDSTGDVLRQWPGGKDPGPGGYSIPSTATAISPMAFQGADKVKKITIHQDVNDIGSGAFTLTGTLESIVVDSANYVYSSGDGILYDKGKQILIQYPAGKAGSEFTIPSTVTIIDSLAFSGCFLLKTVVISENVSNITDWAFYYCRGLKAFSVVSSNDYFRAVDGVLFTKDKEDLISYPYAKAGKYYIIPGTTKLVVMGAIGNSNLKVVEIPKSVLYLPEYCIQGESLYIVGSTADAKAYAKSMGIPYVEKTKKVASPKAKALGGKAIKVSWKKLKGASGYEVYRATSKNGKYSKVKTITKGKTVSFTNKNLQKGKKYFYIIKAYKKVNGVKVYGPFSNKVSKKAV